MATSTGVYLGGLSSGLDTTSIVNKLVAVQGNQQTLLKDRQANQNNAVSAYSAMLSNIGSMVTQMKTLANTSAWGTTSATSTSTTVSASATGSVATSLSFDVKTVAKAQTLISDGSVNSTGANVTGGASTISLTKNGTATTINVGTGSLSEVVSAINGANAGVTATAVQTAPGSYRLQVASTSTGQASSFTLSGLSGFTGGSGGVDAMKTLVAGADASIEVGGAGGYTVTSPTNTFATVADGLSFTVSKVESGVTVSSAVDTTKVTDQISGVVTNINNLLSSIQTNTAWDPVKKTGGPLMGDSTVRALQQQVLNTVAGMNAPGLSVTSGGQVQFDKTAFDTAYKTDPAGTMAAWGANSSFTAAAGVSASAKYTNATTATEAGDYDVHVTQQAKAEQWQVIPPNSGVVGRTVALLRGTTKVEYEYDDTKTVEQNAAALNTQLAQSGMGITAAASGGNLVFSAANPGSAGAFTAQLEGVNGTRSVTGADIAGTIDGVEAKGIGNILTVPTDAESGAKGLSVQITSTATGDLGSISYQPGISQSLGQLFNQMSDSQSGSLVQAQTTAKNQAKDLQTQIDSWTDRLEAYRATITAKFTAMETSLSTLKSQQSSLTSFFNTASSSSSS
jgi:flagellar hook-associated protein 2